MCVITTNQKVQVVITSSFRVCHTPIIVNLLWSGSVTKSLKIEMSLLELISDSTVAVAVTSVMRTNMINKNNRHTKSLLSSYVYYKNILNLQLLIH